jgi:hypothetical protein
MHPQLWRAEGNVVRLQLPRLSAAVDPLNPEGGLRQLQIDSQPLPGFDLLGVELSRQSLTCAAVESYVRGGDLVATYPETADRAFRVQIYWRAGMYALHGAIAAVELVASVQTSLLDTCPQLTTHSIVTAEEAFQLEDVETGNFVSVAPTQQRHAPTDSSNFPPCHLFRPAATNFSYVEIVVPTEGQVSQCESVPEGNGFRFRLARRLFAERLEKGVILRTRVIGLLVDRRGDLAAAWRQYQAILAAAPPLTT